MVTEMKNTLEGINSTSPEPKNEQVTRKTMAEISATEQQQKSHFIYRGTLYANLRDICVKSKCKISQIWT